LKAALRGNVLMVMCCKRRELELTSRPRAHDIPARIATGAYVLHAGWEKWHGNEERATAVHGMAAGAFPFLKKLPPAKFLRLLAAAEVVTGALLLAPVVPNQVAGAALTAFSGGLITMYMRTPSLHKPGSYWPTPAGTAVSKDIWMLGIGLGLLADRAVAAAAGR
jgi:uncharacterized membrane protein YphA (DoxX/SURF4 family)